VRFRAGTSRCVSLALFIAAISSSVCASPQDKKTELSVLLYPWVPDYEHIAATLERDFENANPDIDLVPSSQNWDYYEPGGLEAKYDVYELDGVFLADFVAAGRLQSINPAHVTVRSDALPAAAAGVHIGGAVYGVPHWACALFTFYFKHDSALAAAVTRTDLVSTIGANHEQGRGLLVDWKGHSTLAELYADCLLDLGNTGEDVVSMLSQSTLDPAALTALSALISLSDVGSGRSDIAHKAWPPYYSLEFAHARGRALVGYSERMFHILNEVRHPTDPTPVIDASTITVRLYNQGVANGNPLVWVDSFALDKDLAGPRLSAAERFIAFATSTTAYRTILLPPNEPPQYLLPAYTDVFADATLLASAPLYQQFAHGLDHAATLAAVGLPAALETTGTTLDKKLPINLQHR
jgi:thiamine pyridinylase